MSRPLIKFCGMTRPEDIEVALSLGVDFLGLILVPESPRALDVDQALALRQQIGSRAQVVLLTRDAAPADVATWARILNPDVLQFHGRERAEHCAEFGQRWWKAVPMGELTGREALDEFVQTFRQAERLLFDSHGGTHSGGRGHKFDWTRVTHLSHEHVLAGGLNPDNVGEAVIALAPWAVDVSSGIESSPGRKDPARMQAFVTAARAAATPS